MTDSDYKKKILQELESAKSEEANRDVFSMIEKGASALESDSDEAPAHVKNEEEFQRAIQIVFDKGQEARSRILAVDSASTKIGDSALFFEKTIDVLNDNSQPIELRTCLLSIMKQTSFNSSVYKEKRPQILEVLRRVALDSDTPKSYRDEVIGFLAMNKDESIQVALQRGLDDPSAAIVEPKTAVKLLGYDIHAVNFEKLKSMVTNADQDTKLAIVRVLSADPNSKNELIRLASDQSEATDVRAICLAGLSSLAPSEYKNLAEKLVLDESESDEIRAASLSGYQRAKQIANSSALEAAGSTEIDEKIFDVKSRAKGIFLKAIDKYLKKEK